MSTKHHFLALDGMRGLAAISVLLYHISMTSAPWILPHAPLAVDFFFILSGFVVASAYETRLKQGMGFWRFISVRLARLYPLIFLGVIIGCVGYYNAYSKETLAVITLAGFFLVPTSYGTKAEDFNVMPVNPQSWSLTFELLINAVYGLLYRLPNIALLVIVASSAVIFVTASFLFGSANLGGDWFSLWGGVPRVSFGFFSGVLLFRLWNETWRDRISETFFFASSAMMIAILFAPKHFAHAWFYECAVVLFVFPATVFLGAATRVSWLSAIIVLLGELSYPVYILQSGILPHMRGLPSHMGLRSTTAVLVLLLLAVVFCAFSWFVLKYFDEPIRGGLTILLNGKRKDAGLDSTSLQGATNQG